MMTNQPLVSCIIIFFNAGKPFFLEAIQSIFDQTYENWELLLVDDGSTDCSTEIALEYARTYPERVSYLQHEAHQNLGMSATRNLGIRHAKGEYVTFLDADDVWVPSALQEQTAILNHHPDAAMVYGPIQWWYSWTTNSEDESQDFIDLREEAELKNLGLHLDRVIHPPTLFLLLLKDRISISGMLIRKSMVEQVKGFEDQFRGLYEDQVFCSKVCLQFPVFVASQCWYKYRQHPGSCCNVDIQNKLNKHSDFLNWLEQYVLQQGLASPKVWQTIQVQLLPYRHPKLDFVFKRVSRLVNRLKSSFRTFFKKSYQIQI